MYDEPIYYTSDLIKEYAARRKGISEEEVEDLLRCLIKYLYYDITTDNNYAYKIPRVGVLYTKLDTERKYAGCMSKNKRFNEMVMDTLLNTYRKTNRLTSPERVKKSKEELQKWQNSGE